MFDEVITQDFSISLDKCLKKKFHLLTRSLYSVICLDNVPWYATGYTMSVKLSGFYCHPSNLKYRMKYRHTGLHKVQIHGGVR